MTVAIVGAGFCGTMVAVHLAKMGFPGKIVLFESRPHLGEGAAYSTRFDGHLLNVPAFGMTAYPDEPEHFAHWAARLGFADDAFVPRRIYGEYVKAQLPEEFEWVHGEVVDGKETGGGLELVLANGSSRRVDRAVLALGNFPPAPLHVDADAGFYDSPLFVGNPWSDASVDGDVLLVGTGLTAVDKVLELARPGRMVYALSRHGLRPRPHQEPPVRLRPDEARTLDPSLGALSLARQLRAEVKREGDWRRAVASLRSSCQSIWEGLAEEEKRRYGRHLRPLWDNLRHQIPADAAHRLNELEAAGQLRFLRGRLRHFALRDGRALVSYGEDASVTVDRVVSCTGPAERIAKLPSPLLQALFASGLARPNSLGMGVAVDEDLRASSRIYALGPLLKGQYFETIAVPELRVQALRVARSLSRG